MPPSAPQLDPKPDGEVLSERSSNATAARLIARAAVAYAARCGE